MVPALQGGAARAVMATGAPAWTVCKALVKRALTWHSRHAGHPRRAIRCWIGQSTNGNTRDSADSVRLLPALYVPIETGVLPFALCVLHDHGVGRVWKRGEPCSSELPPCL